MRLLPLPGVFQPHSDSLLLADSLRREAIGPATSVLDLCTGSGLLAVRAALLGAARVVAVDVSRRAIASARINAWINRVSVDAVRGDLFGAVDGQRFDLIVSNPPYLPGPQQPQAHGASRAWEAGLDGRLFIDRICASAADHLMADGSLLLVHSSVCGEQRTLETLAEHGLRPRVLARSRGPLGPRLRARAGWLRTHGLLGPEGYEEVLVIRATRSAPRSPAAPAGGWCTA